MIGDEFLTYHKKIAKNISKLIFYFIETFCMVGNLNHFNCIPIEFHLVFFKCVILWSSGIRLQMPKAINQNLSLKYNGIICSK